MTERHLDPDCLFCRIVSGEIAAKEVARTDAAVAFLDLAPKAVGHTLVVPTRHVADLTCDADALTEIAPLVSQVAARLVERLGAGGVNAVVNSGAAAGQEIFHLHVHLIPSGTDEADHASGLDAEDLDAVLAHVVRA